MGVITDGVDSHIHNESGGVGGDQFHRVPTRRVTASRFRRVVIIIYLNVAKYHGSTRARALPKSPAYLSAFALSDSTEGRVRMNTTLTPASNCWVGRCRAQGGRPIPVDPNNPSAVLPNIPPATTQPNPHYEPRTRYRLAPPQDSQLPTHTESTGASSHGVDPTSPGFDD